jgi:hypothetical protein
MSDVMQQFGNFQDPGCQDDRRSDQKGKARGRLVVQAGKKAAEYGCTRTGDTRDECRALPQPDHQGTFPRQGAKFASGRLASDTFSHNEPNPVQNQERGCHFRGTKQAAEFLLQAKPKNHSRQRGDRRQPDQSASLSNILALSQANCRLGQINPSGPKVDEQRGSRSKMKNGENRG